MRPLFSVLQKTAPAAWKLPTRGIRTPDAAWKFESVCTKCKLQQRRQFSRSRELTDSLLNVDHPAKLVRVNQKHGPGLIILGMLPQRNSIATEVVGLGTDNESILVALIPIISFALGTWQVQRLEWKTKLVAKFEDRLVRPPLPLPPRVDPDAISEFDYRRVYATGHFDHEKEMLIGPRMWEGEDGFMVVTPLKRGDDESTVLVNRGWIARKLANQKDRPDGLPRGEVTVEGLLREPWKKNMFTPENKPQEGKFYFPDIDQMAELSGSQPVWIEQTMGKNCV